MSLYTFTVKNVPISGSTARTVLEIVAPTAKSRVKEWWAEFNSTNAAYEPVQVELTRGFVAFTGSAVTPSRYDGSDGVPTVLAYTSMSAATQEGTVGEAIEHHNIPPTSGIIKQLPLGQEIQMLPISASTFASGSFRIRCTAPTFTVSGSFGVLIEE